MSTNSLLQEVTGIKWGVAQPRAKLESLLQYSLASAEYARAKKVLPNGLVTECLKPTSILYPYCFVGTLLPNIRREMAAATKDEFKASAECSPIS